MFKPLSAAGVGILLSACVARCEPAIVSEQGNKHPQLVEQGRDESRNTIIVYYSDPQSREQEIWVQNQEHTDEKFVYRFSRHAHADVSYDGRWLIVIDAADTGGDYPVIFKQTSPLQYERAANFDFRGVARDYFYSVSGVKPPNALYKIEFSPRGWSQDGDCALFSLFGRDTHDNFNVHSWLFVFDLVKQTFSNDLAKWNAQAVKLKKLP